MNQRVAVIGAGSWGTALAHALANAGREVGIWARDASLARRIEATRRNPAYLPGVSLHPGIVATGSLEPALDGAGVAIFAVPTHGMRAVAELAAALIPGECVVVSGAKGFEAESGATMTSVLADTLGAADGGRHVAALSGPNLAPEVARGLPCASVVACAEERIAATVRDVLNGPQLRMYSSDDVRGVEYGGGLKNVIAIAAGICDGLGAGDNSKAAMITRGLAEMTRLGVCAGARPLTFAGLTGLGDCIVTCTSPHSRNRRLGEAIARGQSLGQVEAGMFMVAEGVNATRAAVRLAAMHGVEMPIAAEVHAILFDGKPLADAISDLMHRDAVDELHQLGLASGRPAPVAGSGHPAGAERTDSVHSQPSAGSSSDG